MPNTWQSIVLRICTFIAIGSSMWYTIIKLFSLAGLTQYAEVLAMTGKPGLMIAFSAIIYAVILFALYAMYARFAYVSLARQLYFCQVSLPVFDFRKILDIAVITISVCKTLLNIVYYFNPLYEELISGIINPLLVAGIMFAALYAVLLKVGKQNKEAVICSLAIWFCIPVVFA